MKLPVAKDAGHAPNAYPGAEKECIYCKSPRGEEHKADCVCVKRTVVLEMTIKFVKDVPASWTGDTILFFFNDSSHCADNEFDTIADSTDDEHCLCFRSNVKYVGEATEADHEQFRYSTKGEN